MSTQQILNGAKLGLPIMIGYLPLGFAFGVLAVKNDVPALWATLMSILVFAGAGQFIAVGMIGAGASILSIVIATFMVNLRHILMSASLTLKWKNLSSPWQHFLALFQTDEVFAVNISLQQEAHAYHALSSALVAQSGWIIGTALGAFSSSLVTDVKPYGLDFALPSMFIALLVPLCINKLKILIALFSALASIFFFLLGFDRWSIIIATILAATLGTYLVCRQEQREEKDNSYPDNNSFSQESKGEN